MKNIYIGTSGWHYEHWAGIYYPQDLEKDEWLRYYSKDFKTVEINSSFYRLPKKETFIEWFSKTPEDFIFAVKASRYITHMKKLSGTSDALFKLFKASSGLRKKLKLFLFQLPEMQGKDFEKLKNFLKMLPEKYDHVFEFRHESWFEKDIYDLLDSFNCGIVIANSQHYPYHEIVTGNLCYFRMHGGKSHSSEYNIQELKETAKKVKHYHKKGLKVFIYFNNDAQGFAINNAKTITQLLNV
jgi:uncharacterized protein YecE (DUF72 family)